MTRGEDNRDAYFLENYGQKAEEFLAEFQQEWETNAALVDGSPMFPDVPGGYKKKNIPTKLRWAVFKRDQYRCVRCGCDEDLTADHIQSERLGGEATLENLQTLCRRCNGKKGAC